MFRGELYKVIKVIKVSVKQVEMVENIKNGLSVLQLYCDWRMFVKVNLDRKNIQKFPISNELVKT